MDYLKQFLIPFSGLKIGNHAFDFEIDPSFFEKFETSEIHSGSVQVHLDMEKQDRMLILDFNISGTVALPCDRCGEPLYLAINGTEKLFVKRDDRYEEESEDVQIIPETDNVLDISSFIYEYIHLLLPARRIHPDDEKGDSRCDPEILKKLKELSENHTPDPRWEILQKLRDS